MIASDGIAYHDLQTTRPETIGISLADSPVGQAAWIYEKLASWNDSDGQAENVFRTIRSSTTSLLIGWSSSGASSARMYAEHPGLNFGAVPLDLPVAVSVFPGEIYTPLKAWAEQAYSNLIYWNKVSKGVHFAAFEQPALFVSEVRAAFASLR